MISKEIFEEIEKDELTVRVNAVSGLSNFLKALQKESAVKNLLSSLKSPIASYEVIQRILTISHVTPDSKYEHPQDTAIAIYLWSISIAQTDLAKRIADFVYKLPQTWWAKKMAKFIKEETEIKNKAADVEQESWADLLALTTKTYKTCDWEAYTCRRVFWNDLAHHIRSADDYKCEIMWEERREQVGPRFRTEVVTIQDPLDLNSNTIFLFLNGCRATLSGNTALPGGEPEERHTESHLAVVTNVSWK